MNRNFLSSGPTLASVAMTSLIGRIQTFIKFFIHIFLLLLFYYKGMFYVIGCVKIILRIEQIKILGGPISQFSKKKKLSICQKFFLDNFYASINVTSSLNNYSS